MFQSSRPPSHVHPAPAGPSRPRKPVLPRRRRGPRLRDGGGEAGAGVPVSVRAAPHRVGDPSRPERRDATPAAEPEPRRGGEGGAAQRREDPGSAPAYLRWLSSQPATAPAGGRREAVAGRRRWSVAGLGWDPGNRLPVSGTPCGSAGGTRATTSSSKFLRPLSHQPSFAPSLTKALRRLDSFTGLSTLGIFLFSVPFTWLPSE
ncbi:uncharacterized protein LOC109493050 [Felis catus]|uniref:uncharacterized protein LOC109493050 n=1 Tax=Felis catus TaxID=9685 RepID=UPI001D1A0938|nr:uncharacterized protein LOC109493050 [Felis catus]